MSRIVITGGAGFIGSALLWELNREGERDVLVVDRLDDSGKWRNLAPLRFADYMEADDFLTALEAGRLPRPELVLHMGAESATTATDAGWLWRTNMDYTQRLATWCLERDIRFVYASSAATYGDGALGFSDEPDRFDHLRPLNPYGFSKLWFDRVARDRGWLDRITGLRFFNVYGPNEYHKGDMRSVVPVFTRQILETGACRLFRSVDPEIPDGHQRRDFIWIGDVVDATLWLARRPEATGVFNVGTGRARTFLDLAHAVFAALDRPPEIEWIPTPEALRATYQSFTEAELGRLRGAGYEKDFTELEESVSRYITAITAGDRCLDPDVAE